MISASPRPSDAPAPALAVHVLGSGSGYPTAERDTSSLLVDAPDGWTLVDCPGSVVQKLARLGIVPSALRRVIMTHDHVDHVYGFPHLLQALAIEGVAEELEVCAPTDTLATVDRMIEAHELGGTRYPDVHHVIIPPRPGAGVVDAARYRITAAPALHGRETVSLCFSVAEASLCYSSDTRPSADLDRLARGAEVLLHDCAGPHRLRADFRDHHSSAREAGLTAARAGVGVLVLTHLGARSDRLLRECRAEAAETFDGPVTVAADGDVWHVPGSRD